VAKKLIQVREYVPRIATVLAFFFNSHVIYIRQFFYFALLYIHMYVIFLFRKNCILENSF
jgi:hypothetical protein